MAQENDYQPLEPLASEQEKRNQNVKYFELQVPKYAVLLSKRLCCKIFCSQRNKQTHVRIMTLVSLMIFVHLLSLAILPMIIWVFVLPLQVISLLTSTCAVLFFLMAFVAVLISNPTQSKSNGEATAFADCSIFFFDHSCAWNCTLLAVDYDQC